MLERLCSLTEDVDHLAVKILVIGDHLTGKSTILDTFCETKESSAEFLSNIFDYKEFTDGCDIHIKKMKLKINSQDSCIQ